MTGIILAFKESFELKLTTVTEGVALSTNLNTVSRKF